MEQKDKKFRLFNAIFFVLSSFAMVYLFIVFIALAIAIGIGQKEISWLINVEHWLIIITAGWFFVYGLLMFSPRLAKMKFLTIINLVMIGINLVTFVVICIMVNSGNLGAVFRVMWPGLLIYIVGVVGNILLLTKYNKQKMLDAQKLDEARINTEENAEQTQTGIVE